MKNVIDLHNSRQAQKRAQKIEREKSNKQITAELRKTHKEETREPAQVIALNPAHAFKKNGEALMLDFIWLVGSGFIDAESAARIVNRAYFHDELRPYLFSEHVALPEEVLKKIRVWVAEEYVSQLG